jgi:hypothetical protein
MSSGGGHSSPKRFLLATNGDLVNLDYIMRIFLSGSAVMADMQVGPDIQLAGDAELIVDLRRTLPINGQVA